MSEEAAAALDAAGHALEQADREIDRTMREWISITRYAQKYGIARHTLYKWMDAGIVEFFRVERCVRLRDRPPRQAA